MGESDCEDEIPFYSDDDSLLLELAAERKRANNLEAELKLVQNELMRSTILEQQQDTRIKLLEHKLLNAQIRYSHEHRILQDELQRFRVTSSFYAQTLNELLNAVKAGDDYTAQYLKFSRQAMGELKRITSIAQAVWDTYLENSIK